MSRKIFLYLLLCLVIVGQIWARPFDRHKDSFNYKTVAAQGPDRIIRPGDEITAARELGRPLRDDADDHVAYGEHEIIGYTWYDYQHNGSIGKMIARDGEGGTHFVWMAGYNAQLDPRHVLYNFIDEDGGMLNDPDNHGVVDNGSRSGYCMIDVLPENNLGVPFYHVLGHIDDDAAQLGVGMSVDWLRGVGAFVPDYPPPMANVADLAWPHGAIDRQNFAHITATENSGADQTWQRVAYWRGEPDRDFQEWDWGEQPVIIDTASVISAVVATSSQSDKVALGWHKNRVGSDIGAWENALGGYQRNNDIVYIVSEDGEEWDWRDGIMSITKILPPIPDLAGENMAEAYGDTFRPYCDLDLQFDPWEGEDNLYAVFAASGFKEEPYEDPGEDGDPEPVDLVYAVHGHLWFWNSVEDTITMIADGWYDNYMNNPNAARNFRPGVWRLNADRGSIAFDPDDPGTIYVVWTSFPHIANAETNEDGEVWLDWIDGAAIQDTSEWGYLNAEVMVSISNDRGLSWRQPINVTETIWEGNEAPEPGECMSENWMSVAKVADGALHIIYIMDTDAGGIAQNEGVATNSPVMYHRIDLEDLPQNELVEIPDGFQFHNYYDAAPRVHVERTTAAPVPDSEVLIIGTVTPPGGLDLEEVVLEYKIGGEDGEMMTVEMSPGEDDMFTGVIPGLDDGSWVWYRVRAVDSDEGETIVPSGWWQSYVVRPEGELRIRDIQFRPNDWVVDYSPYMDYEVTFDGVITTDSEFALHYGGYGFQDAEEEWSGVIIRGIDEELEIGETLTILGMVMEQDPNDNQKWRFMTYIQVASYEITGMQDPWDPIQIEVDDMRFATLAENLEGCLVALGNTEVRDRAGAPDNYIPIVNSDPENNSAGWITTYGMDEDEAEETFGDAVRGTRIASLTGIFVENQRYAIAIREVADVGEMAVKDNGVPTPSSFSLDAAYPNPFNSKTTIGFNIAKTSNVSLNIYDLEGRLVQTLLSGSVQAGHYTYSVDAANFAAGMYLLRFEAGEFTANQKLLLIK